VPNHKYTWKRSLPDFRNYPAPRDKLLVPTSVDLTEEAGFPFIAPWNQLSIGSCTANAVDFCAWDFWAKHFTYLKEGFSRLFIYAKERDYEGTALTDDAGAYGHDGFRLFRKFGAPLESSWPYIDKGGDWTEEPPTSLLAEAARYKIPFYRHPRQTKKAIQSALARSYPVAFGFTVYESFESSTVASTGYVPLPQPTENILGGHEVVIVGYDSHYVKCRNSWGTDWGDGGYFYMPWAYVLNPQLCDDFRYFCEE